MGFDPMILRLEGVRVILTTLMNYLEISLKSLNRPTCSWTESNRRPSAYIVMYYKADAIKPLCNKSHITVFYHSYLETIILSRNSR